jgi:hypothetical protein
LGPLKDSGEEQILKFAKRLGITDKNQINFDVLGIKNYCSNLLKQNEAEYFLEWKPTQEQLKIMNLKDDEKKAYLEQQTKLTAIKMGLIDENGNLLDKKTDKEAMDEDVRKNISSEAKEIIEGCYLINFKEGRNNKIHNQSEQVAISQERHGPNVSEDATNEIYNRWKKEKQNEKIINRIIIERERGR